jgi:prepilin peptidase CpaA
MAPVVGMDWQTFGLHWASGGLVFAVAFFCFAMGWIGGGDAKLASVAALWLGWDGSIEFIALASIFGGVLTVLILVFRRSVLPAFVVRQPWVQRLHDERAGVPYGVALAIAGLATYPHSIWVGLVTGCRGAGRDCLGHAAGRSSRARSFGRTGARKLLLIKNSHA